MSGVARAPLAAAASVVLGAGALWRAGLALRHHRISLGITNDPSARELREVSALIEAGLGVVLLAHALAAAYLTRHPLRLHGVVVLGVAGVTGVLMAAALSQTPILGAPGVLVATVALCGAAAGLRSRAPWTSVYVGVVVGSVIGLAVAAPSHEPIVAAAVAAPAVVFALVGVAGGRIVRRASP